MMWICNSSETARFTGDGHRSRNFSIAKDEEDDRDSSSSSSIGNNSDASGGGCDSDDGGEVQSLFKGSLNNLSDLEEALAVKRGISTFYSGKSKSYTSLADAVCAPSIQDIVKPEDAYNRKRKNMLAHNIILNKNRNFTSKSGIPKKVANVNNRYSLASELNNHHHNNAGGESSSPGSSLPPLPARHRISPVAINESLNSSPRNFCSPWRSFSLSDLQLAGGGGAASSFTGNKRDDEEDDD
ncbi:hypothetical protein HanOQP8_Chr12g0429401 [Helianthus annuus]|nr:hypothetical protein HanOQP8_Chr12g0429401 [Helianthus annuus]